MGEHQEDPWVEPSAKVDERDGALRQVEEELVDQDPPKAPGDDLP